MLIIQNQQYKHELEHQSNSLTLQLQKNEQLQGEIRSLKV